MDVSSYPLAVNLVVAVISLSPVLMMLYFYKAFPPKYYGLLLWSLLQISWAAFVFGWLSDTISALEVTNAVSDPEIELKKDILANLRTWVYVFPAVTAAVGANLITEFLVRSKPD